MISDEMRKIEFDDFDAICKHFCDKYGININNILSFLDDEDISIIKHNFIDILVSGINDLFYAIPKPRDIKYSDYEKLKKDNKWQKPERLPDVTFNDKYQLYVKETAGKILEVYFKTYGSALKFRDMCIEAAHENDDNIVDEQIILYVAGYGRPNQPKPYGKYVYDIDEFESVKILSTCDTKHGIFRLCFFCNEWRYDDGGRRE